MVVLTTIADKKPTILLVQGAFQLPMVYKSLVKGLEANGYSVVQPPLPSCTDVDAPDFPKRTLADDAQSVHRALTRLVVQESKRVVIVMHSYGGLVGSEAVSEELGYFQRMSQGLAGGVLHLFYYTAFILPKNTSVLETFGESPNNDVRPDGRYTIRNAAKTIYNDLTDNEAALWESRIILQSYNVQRTKLSGEAYGHITSTYLICDDDQAVPPKYQEMFANRAKAQVYHCNASHSPHLSQPDALVQRIVKTVEEVSAIAP